MNRREALKLLGITGVGLSGITGIKHLLTAPDSWDHFEHYLFAHKVFLPTDYAENIENIITCAYQPKKRIQQYQNLSSFFNCPLTVYTDDLSFHKNSIQGKNISFVTWPWIRDLITYSGNDLLIRPSWDDPEKNTRIISRKTTKMKKLIAKQEIEILELISQVHGLEKKVAPIFHEGGCVLKTSQHTLFPRAYLSPHRFHEKFLEQATPAQRKIHSAGNFQELYESIFGPCLFVPNTYRKNGQEKIAFTGHIDVFLAPLDDQTIVVGDIKKGYQLVSDLNRRELSHWEEKTRKYISHPQLKSAQPRLIIDETEVDYLSHSQEVLDQVANFLGEHYNVKRVPMPIIGLFQDYHCAITYPLIYTNCLLEETTKKAAVPIYGLATLDQEAEQVYKSAGYSNFLGVDSLRDLFTFSGLRCNYLEKRKKLS